MKTFFFSLLLCSSVIASAQWDEYIAAGLSLKFKNSEAMQQSFDAFNDSCDIIYEKLEAYSFLPTITIANGYWPGDWTQHVELGGSLKFVSGSGKQGFTEKVADMHIVYLFVAYELGYPAVDVNDFQVIPGIGPELEIELFGGHIDTEHASYYGGIANFFNAGINAHCRLMKTFGDDVGVVVKPYYLVNFVKNNYGDLYEKISGVSPEEHGLSIKTKNYFGLNFMVAFVD